jgi:hypothetical protein
MMELIQFNLRRIPYFKAWGIFAFMGDVTIWLTSESMLVQIDDGADPSDVLPIQSKGEYATSTTKVVTEVADYST